MMEPEADLGADSSSPVDVTVAGGHFGHAVLGTQIVNRNTIVHQHGVNADSPALSPGHFRLSVHITVSENDPINRDSCIYRAKLHREIFGDLEIAVKILSDGERQRREARIHFRIPHHINIVERILADAFKYRGQSCIYIAMEECDPENLYAHVVSLAENNAPYDAKMFMSFAFQIATGLEFLHRHKILNRDLKPENILLSLDKKIAKIADFGMSKEMTGEASTVSALQPGTDGWRSPEILKNVKRITLASDMFSLGLIFHFLWSYGKHAFGDDHHAWNLYIKRGTNMTLDGLKIPNVNAAKRLLKSLLSQNPADRPSALEVLRGVVFEAEGTKENVATLDPPTGKKIANMTEMRRDLRGYDIRVQKFARDFAFGKEWEGRFSDQKVTIAQYFEDDWEKLENTVSALSDLEHENIVHLIEEVSKISVIITEFCEYGTLKEYVAVDEGKRAELSDLLRMAAQVASGMDFLHRKNYIHCDLRAENVVVSANLICKISGLSLARHAGPRGGFVLPPGETDLPFEWAAQEVLEDHQTTFKSDVWSFGILLWEIFSGGQKPYPGCNRQNAVVNISKGIRMLKPKKCPSKLYFDVMRVCWDKDPDARPTFQSLEETLLTYDVEAEEEEESMTVKAQYDWTADKEDKLSFKIGDIIVDCMGSDEDGWWRGTLNGRTGFFPVNFVIQIRSQKA